MTRRHLPMMPTASALERVLACPASAVLPQIHLEVSDDARRGSAIGAFVRDILNGEPVEEVLARVPDEGWRETCRRLILPENWNNLVGDLTHVRAEVAYAVATDDEGDFGEEDARELGLNLGRKYPPLREGEIAGTNDFEGWMADGTRVACDIKSGREVTGAQDNPQGKHHTLAQYYAHKAAKNQIRFLYVREDGKVWRDPFTFTPYDHHKFHDDLREMRRRIVHAQEMLDAGKIPTVTTGPQCTHCPAKIACPAHVRLALAMTEETAEIAGMDVALIPMRIQALSPERAKIAYEKASAVHKVSEIVLKGCREVARQRPFLLSNGKELRETEVHSDGRMNFVPHKALAMLRELGATQTQIDSLYELTPAKPSVRELKPRKEP